MEKTETRWENYRLANSMRPHARERELQALFELLNPKSGERIWEIGTGNGYLTFPIAQAVTPDGIVITSDVEPGNIEEVQRKNVERKLPIETRLLQKGDITFRDAEDFDAVASIATLHHYDDRISESGESGRRRALHAFFKALKPGGRLVVSDVLHGTISQVYFDAIDDPRYCAPLGHPHDFFTREALAAIAKECGFTDIEIDVRSVPWTFTSLQEAQEFVHTIHNAECSPEESFDLAQKILGFNKVGERYELGWELFFLSAKKTAIKTRV